MGRFTRDVAGKAKEKAKNAYEKAEAKVLAAEGRKSVKRKVRTVAKVGKKAVKAGLVAGAMAAATVVYREIKKRRALS